MGARRLAAAVILACAVTASAVAGDLSIDDVAAVCRTADHAYSTAEFRATCKTLAAALADCPGQAASSRCVENAMHRREYEPGGTVILRGNR